MLGAVSTGEGDSLPPPPPTNDTAKTPTALPLDDGEELPADLRMNEYDDGPTNVNLVGAPSEVVGTSLDASGIPQEEILGESEDDDEEDEEGDDMKDADGDADSNSDDDVMSDDEYDPLMHDPREYEPTDTAALTAMGLGHTSTHPKQGFYFGDEGEDGEPEVRSERREGVRDERRGAKQRYCMSSVRSC